MGVNLRAWDLFVVSSVLMAACTSDVAGGNDEATSDYLDDGYSDHHRDPNDYNCGYSNCLEGSYCVDDTSCRPLPELAPCADNPTAMQIPDVDDVLELRFADLDGDGTDELVVFDGPRAHVLDDVDQGTTVITTELDPSPGTLTPLLGRIGVIASETLGESPVLVVDNSLVRFDAGPGFEFQPGSSFEVQASIDGLYADVLGDESKLVAWSASATWFFGPPPSIRSFEGSPDPVETAVVDDSGLLVGIGSRVRRISAASDAEPIEWATHFNAGGPVRAVVPDGARLLLVGYDFADWDGPPFWTNFDTVDLEAGTTSRAFAMPGRVNAATAPVGNGELRLAAGLEDHLVYVWRQADQAWSQACLGDIQLPAAVVSIDTGDHDGDGDAELACVLEDGSAWFIDLE